VPAWAKLRIDFRNQGWEQAKDDWVFQPSSFQFRAGLQHGLAPGQAKQTLSALSLGQFSRVRLFRCGYKKKKIAFVFVFQVINGQELDPPNPTLFAVGKHIDCFSETLLAKGPFLLFTKQGGFSCKKGRD